MKTKKILIVTKTYPEISKKYGETVCTAGILLDENERPLHWIRIYPVRFRHLDKRYPKWAIISASIERNHKDNRWESYRVDDNSIKIIRETRKTDKWEERRTFFESFVSNSIGEIRSRGDSIGLIKPKVMQYSFSTTAREWPEDKKVILDQGDLFRNENPFLELEKIPYKFYYHFNDKDGPHKCSIIDWEISQLYRNMRNKSQKATQLEREEDALEKVRFKLVDQFLQKDLYLLMGNLKKYQNRFVIIGIVYPPVPAPKQMQLNF